jgi:hypothetical protein
MKRFFKVCAVVILLSSAAQASAPEPVTTCLACVSACTGQGKGTPVCLLQCVTSGACVRP